MNAKQRVLLAVGAALLLLLLVLFRSRAPEAPPPSIPPRPEFPPSMEPARVPEPPRPKPEEPVARPRTIEETLKKEPVPPPQEPPVRWIGPLSLQIQFSAPVLPGEAQGARKDIAALYVSQLPIPVQFWIGKIPQQEVPPVPVQLSSWRSAIRVSIARDLDPSNALVCDLQLRELHRGIGQDRIDGDSPPLECPANGLSLAATLQPPAGFRLPGRYVLQAELDSNVLFGLANRWEVQKSPKVVLELRQETTPDDRINAMNAETEKHLEAKDYPKAIESAQAVLRLKPTSIAAHYDLAIALWKNGADLQQAIGMMEKAAESLERGLDPDPAYKEERTKRSALNGMRGWIAARRRDMK